ncbi:RNA-directed DNA polymerase, eukaryota, reverse transcriptase zinc-binding domain protein, partial [Tanacetum coccineum]
MQKEEEKQNIFSENQSNSHYSAPPKNGGIAGNPKEGFHSSANSSKNATKPRSGKSQKSFRINGSLIDAFISHIEMGSMLSPSIGKSGGLLTVWDPSCFYKAHVTAMDNVLVVEGEWSFKSLKCFMLNVYAPQDDRKKQELWRLILHFMASNPGNYFIFGDFNVVCYASERIGSTFNYSSANDFNQFLKEGNLYDPPLGGHAFTRISSDGEKLSRLDRFLISYNLAITFPYMHATTMDRMISDHRAIILQHSDMDFGPIPFKFFNSWLQA